MSTSALSNCLQQRLRAVIGLDPAALGAALMEQPISTLRALNEGLDDRQLIDLLTRDETQLTPLLESVLVPETWFLRDPAQFVDLAARAPGLARGETLQVLSLPCSTGEEPLSIATTLLNAGCVDFHVWGVDLSAAAIAHARAAVYSAHSLRGQPAPSWLQAHHGNWQPDAQVRAHVSYLQLNLLDPDLHLRLPQAHVIFSRNFLIYLHPAAQLQWLATLAALLRTGGVVYTGSAEPLSRLSAAWCQFETDGALHYQRAPAPVITGVTAAARSTVPNKPAPPPAPVVAVTTAVPNTAPANEAERAQIAADAGQLALAETLLAQHLETAPLDIDAWHLSALVQLGLGQETLARERWERVLYLDRRHLGALQHLAALAQRSRDPARAEHLTRRLRAQHHVQSQGPK